MYIALGQGQKIPWGQTFDVNRKPLLLRPFVASFKQISLNSDFIHIFNVFPHVYSPGQGQTTLCGQNPDVNRKALSLCPFVASFKPEDHWSCIAHLTAEDTLKSAVIEEKTFKHSPWAGADNPLGPKL